MGEILILADSSYSVNEVFLVYVPPVKDFVRGVFTRRNLEREMIA